MHRRRIDDLYLEARDIYVAGRLNPLRENAVHHFHELLRRAYRDQPVRA